MINNNINNFKKVVVTGASGYIASLIIKDLLTDNSIEQIVAIVRDKNNVQKYKFLTDLEGASKLVLESGDLETANYEEIFKDADAVLHIASPYIYKSDNPETEIVKPAIAGNVRVLDAASKHPSIKKVVITSSSAAVTDLAKKKEVYNEDDWNDGSNISAPYQFSKYLAEKATWNYKETHPNTHFEIVIINPAFVLGPGLKGYPSLNTSLTTFRDSLLGSCDPAVSNRLVGLIDVRDVAKAHINALKATPNTELLHPNRYLMANTVITFAGMCDLARELFPQFDIKGCEFDSTLSPHKYKLESKSPLKLKQYIDTKTTIKECIEFLIESNFYKPTLKA
ncbi:hypothetical protein DICPUDRAFT_159101 [Dictyostelium purpureum]|uniref:NAD-dependent epimerase/dehydratase domain-containing protein n=1 Tax=Dictyostelium purpureum TaxID=5786 RepID=F1A3A5_DICPU|nr:uncharacterized protein DICPUDRAFT_159101 [Dictyostelium purpureum]EGC29320.1 hypothetical protein DICPUDRAFT_159101 [Dictyostelium purpureum]|eukprot:XP_003294152.1 hypothetical protein DICPUDRAFT_159101 [Dictyostelium purpureum]